MDKQDDGLFLLEVLLDKLILNKSPCFSDKDFRTCVKIECPSVDPLEICDDDPGSCYTTTGGPFMKTFNSGKSCLFSLKQADISKAMSSFPVKLTVYKSLPCGCLPTKIVLGQATIDMTKEFVQTRNNFLEDPTNVSYQALQDSFHIMAPDGTEAGEVLIFLRISCFGKLIVTKFQGGGGPPNLGAGTGTQMINRSCNPPRAYQTSTNPCVCGAAEAAAIGRSQRMGTGPPCNAPCKIGGSQAVCPPARDPYASMPCEEDDPCYCSGPHSKPTDPILCRNTDPYCLHVPKGPSKQFEEIGSNLGGNELKIRVPVKSSIIKKISQTHCAMQRPYTKKDKLNNNHEEEGPCDFPCGKNKISLSLPSEDICCNDARLQGTQFTCTTEGCPLASKHGQQASFARGDSSQEPPNKDVFVLKVAKTATHYDKKCKIELEVVAPKGANKEPPVRKENTRIETEPECRCCHKVRRCKTCQRG